MALRRQGLSQRRKAVGFTQESLAERLGVERSTVVRWEAGDTEPLPSIRPKVARALQVSVDQLAELLTEAENAGATRALSAEDETMVPVLLPRVPSAVQPDRTEFEDPAHPQVADPVEALRQALRSAGVIPEDLGAILMAGRSPWVPLDSAELDRPVTVGADVGPATPTVTEVSLRPPRTDVPVAVEPADVHRRRARSRRFNRLAVMGALLVLAFAGDAVSMPLIISQRGPIPPDAIGTSVPVAAVPVPDFGGSPGSEDSVGAGQPVPALTEPDETVETPEVAVVPAPQTARSDKRTTSRSKPRASTTRPAPQRNPAIPAEADELIKRWSQRE